MTDQWPPAGHKSWYRITESLDESGDVTEFDFSLPAGFETVDLAAARVLRHGGPNEADLAFRSQLYAHIGAVTVAGGHAEAAMKRAILVFGRADEAVFASIERMNWTDLESKLRQIAQSEDSKVSGLTELLDWSAEHRIKGRRDDVIHAYWWDYAECGVRRGRFRRDGTSATIIGTIKDLAEDYRLITTFAMNLDDAIERSWPQARLGTANSGDPGDAGDVKQ